jgi:hypothetical protein
MTKAASTRTNEKNVNEISTKAHFGLNLLHQMEKLQFSALLHKAQPLPLISESAQRFFFLRTETSKAAQQLLLWI